MYDKFHDKNLPQEIDDFTLKSNMNNLFIIWKNITEILKGIDE